MKIQRKAISAYKFDGNIQALREFAAAAMPNQSFTIEAANQDLGSETIVVGGTAWVRMQRTQTLAIGDYVVAGRTGLKRYSPKQFDELFEVVAP